MRIKREFAQSEIADLLDEAIEVDSAPWRHGRKVTYVFSEVQDECPSNDGAQGPFWRCTLDVHHEEGMQLYGPVTCTRVEQKQVMTTQWVAVDAKEDGQGLRIAATAAERRRIMSEEKIDTYDLESVYDEQIAPLMTRIIAICKEHKMPMVATFQYQVIDDGAVDPDPHWCTTVLQWADRGLAGKALDAANAVNPNRRPPAMVLKTLDASGAVTAVEVVMP